MSEPLVPEDVPEDLPTESSTEAAEAAADPVKTQAAEDLADWKVFRLVVAALGVVIAGFGLFDLFVGVKGLPDAISENNATLESNYRFFAAILVGVGAAFVAIAVKFNWANVLIFVCATIFLGGLARVFSWAVSGLPNFLMILLMILELVIPPVIAVWYLWINRTQKLRASYRGMNTVPKQ
ncbi:DUF4345 domain-containing protein [Psychromicrobium lacuslunae]|uniref:DUF4345 domain-containing protein n=1 Tax=Psychromicrobium lacuslunae TaxID=1618207 RepID=A0A0D4BW84_9MICC|nr:DUF4345 domain-containing protein [Psychromicrobium lacuslunae]AJT40554.1 hypothetical protein UM93_01560 [Psychromicrobium lacuslunae]